MYSDMYKKHWGFLPTEDLLRKPLDIPLADSFHIPYNHLERVEIQGGYGVEGNIQEDEGPLEEGVRRVS